MRYNEAPSNPTRADTLTRLTNYTWYTATLGALVDGIALPRDTVRATPTDIVVHLPVVMKEN
jgi:hypothetical protein